MSKYLADRVASMGTTIFTEMSRLAAEYKAVNLGQAFPDWPGHAAAKETARQAIALDLNQYAITFGVPSLRQAIAEHSRRFYNMDVDTNSEVTVVNGCTEAIFSAMLGLTNPGDEIILFEPFYDSYLPAVEFAGGIPRVITLHAPDWHFDEAELRAAFGPRTKAILINTPHNPTGKLFRRSELEMIADLCQQHDVIAVTDEVYEHIVFDGNEHIRLATLPGMWERTITLSSAGKSFSLTGWKVGWAIAPSDLSLAVRRTHQFATFATAAPLQEGIAVALRSDDGYYRHLAADYQERRDFLLAALDRAGLPPIQPHGTYFIMADISDLPFEDDVAFCRWLVSQGGVAAIPPTAFYVNKQAGRHLVRFCFCKQWETLQAAAERLAALDFPLGRRGAGDRRS
ncbi:MAG TPA: aminotransferase [Chloroflexi bacterium]|nr:aminotransferase [Chloroflexota bacterium]